MTIRRSSRRPLMSRLALGVVAALVVASCGGDDSSDDDASSATDDEAEPSETNDAAPATSDDGSSEATESLAPEGCDEIVIGAILSLSGAFSQLGSDGEIAANAFYDTHTEVLGTPLRVQIENDRSDPTASAEAAQRLTSDPCVVAVTGPSVTATMVSAFPRLKESGLPVIVNTPVPYPGYNEEPFIFSPNLTPLLLQMQNIVDYFAALGVTNPIYITGDDATGDAVESQYTGNGLTVERIPLAVTDYEPQLTALRENGHDGVAYVGSGGQPPAHIARGMDALGWDVPLILAPSNLTADFMNVAGDAAEGTRGFIWPAGAGPELFADNPDQQAAVEEILAAVPDEHDLALRPNIGYIWDNHMSLYRAIEEAESVDPDALREVLESQDFWGANGRVIRVPVGEPGADHAGVQPESAMPAVVVGGELVADEDVEL